MVPHVEDESNKDENMARNFIRNSIVPLLQREWRNVEKNIVDFGHNCQTDDDYLDSIANIAALHSDANHVKIPLTFFAYPYPIISRVILSAFDHIDAIENIGKKHVDMIITLANSGENGSRADLPNSLFAAKEYEYMTIARKVAPEPTKIYPMKTGRTTFAEFGTIIVTKTISHKEALNKGLMVLDVDKLPRAAKWRTRREGDMFTKFGGGTKTLNAYFIDKKIPSRLRGRLPVLAYGNEIYAVADVEISDKVRTDRETMEAYVIEFIKD
jgi:tRNA(Ile)-lysidine synthase